MKLHEVEFSVKDSANLDRHVTQLHEKGVSMEGPRPTHLGMRSVTPESPDGTLVQIRSPMEESPPWLRSMVA